MSLYLIVGLLFAVAVAVFAVANTEPVTINFVFEQVRLSLALVIIGSAAAGALAIGILSGVRQLGMRFKLWEGENRSRRYEKESLELRGEKESLEGRAQRLEDELAETEAYAAHLEELLQQRGHDIEALQRSQAPQVSSQDQAEQQDTEETPSSNTGS